tara:strand:+ start:4056 stop:5033 length:978 start_codon:yes stop_codon:yes gene_type:complete
MADIKKLRQKSNAAFKTTVAAVKDENKGGNFNDDRFWAPFFDKEKGTGRAVVRFLPAPDGEDLPWVKIFSHGFKGPTGKWCIENSLTTLGQTCPISEMNSRLWNSGIESDKEIARDQKRRISYYANVLVIEDPHNPANEGKVFLYRFGQKIYKMIEEAMMPEFEEEEALNPFDFWEGANFEIRMKTVAGFRNYDKSFFQPKSELYDGDEEKLQKVWDSCYSLKQFLEPENFKSSDQLKARLIEVLGPTVGSGVETVEGWSGPTESKSAPALKSKPKKEEVVEDDSSDGEDNDDDDNDAVDMSESTSTGSDDDDDDIAFFNNIGKE